MNAETLFSICNLTAMIGWILLVLAPRWRWTSRLVLSGGISLLLAAVYLVLIATTFGKAEGGFGTLADVMKLFSHPWVALAGWVHYLVFDLFVGSWEVRDAQSRGISHWLVIPCLLLTFLLGPIGFLLYHAVRRFTKPKSVEGNLLTNE
ncbi:MAG: ABA4-like family protein [Blastocatellales bacterium]